MDQTMQNDNSLDVETLETSFALIAPQAERLVERFYEELFAAYPAVQPLFANADMTTQQGKLLASLKLVIANLRKPGTLLPALQELGRRHEGYGAQAEHYPAVAATLLTVMAEVAGEHWTTQVRDAWANALGVIAEAMLGAYGSERRSADRPWTAPETTASANEAAVGQAGKIAVNGNNN